MPTKKEFLPLYQTPEWFAIRELVRERANDHCERCGARNGAVGYFTLIGRFVEIDWHDQEAARILEYKVVLIQCGCAHRNNIPGDDRLENLAWWCRGCHLRNDVGHHRRSRQIRKDNGRPLLRLEVA